MKPSRRRKGATLGLVAACVLVIIVLGVGVFFLAKLFGGGREVANATDSGTLNLAKNALIQPAVQLPLYAPGSVTACSEFYGCAYPPPTSITTPATIDLFTYNRCVAQALLVALNAKAESDAGAANAAGSGPMYNASLVLQDLDTVGKTLYYGLDTTQSAGTLTFDPSRPAGVLTGNFFSDANKNNVHMFGNTTVNQAGSYQTAFMKAGGATNVYFVPNTVPTDAATDMPNQTGSPATHPKLQATATSNPDPLNQLNSIPSTSKYYLQGYNGITVTAGGQSLSFYGVPVFPQQKPHLVSLDDFNQSGVSQDPTGSTPPNSFKVSSSAQDVGKTNNIGGAIACAIVGSVIQNANAGNGNQAVSPDFPVAIPTGYIELTNPSGNAVPANGLPTDQSNNIFNNELYGGPGGGLPGGAFGTGPLTASDATAGPNGGGVFGEATAIAAWAAYNASSSAITTPASVGPPATPTVYTTPYNAIQGSGGNPGGSAASPKNGNLYPPTMGIATPSSLIFDATGAQASVLTCLSITGAPANCTAENDPGIPAGNPGGLTNFPSGTGCLAFLNNGEFQNAYGSPMPSQPGSIPGGVSAVDTLKAIVIANFNGAGYHSDVSISVSGGQINSTIVSGLNATTGLGEYMAGPMPASGGYPANAGGEYAVYATPNPANLPQNQFPIQNTGQAFPAGTPGAGLHPSILGLLAQLDSGVGVTASSAGANPNYTFGNAACGSLFSQIVQRVQQIQPKAQQADVESLLNGPVEIVGGSQPTLQMGQTAYIYLKNANLMDTSGVNNTGLHIFACTTPTSAATAPANVPFWTNQNPDGIPSSSAQCSQTYSLINGGAGMVDVSINGNGAEAVNPLNTGSPVKGDNSLHDQPYTQINPPGVDFTANDTGKWTPSSGYGNMLGRLNFADVVSGGATATFSSPN
jgi:hypothetical protein